MKQYLELLDYILQHGEVKEDKFTSSAQNLTITFNKATDEITLLVNNEVYKNCDKRCYCL